MGIETNSDGLTRRYGNVGHEGVGNTRAVSVDGVGGQLVVDFTFDNLPGFDEDAGGGATPDTFSGLQAFLPARSYIQSAFLLITEAWDSAGDNCTLTIGTYEKDGTVIDADSIDGAIAQAAMDAVGDVVVCNGDGVGGVVDVGADDAYILAVTANTPTAGAARLVVNYITV